ncbi:DNA primase [Halocola ammonii]
MKRIIKDYQTITKEQLQLLEKQYPEGFDEDNIISFTTPKGDYIRALEVKTDDTIYLIKISDKMLAKIDDFTDDDFEIGEDVGDFSSEDLEDSGDNDDDDDDDDL